MGLDFEVLSGAVPLCPGKKEKRKGGKMEKGAKTRGARVLSEFGYEIDVFISEHNSVTL